MLESISGRVIGVVGWKDSGKTTVVESLVRVLAGRGFSVGTVKHVHDDVALEPGAADSARHLDAGATCAVVTGRVATLVREQGGDDLEAAVVRYLWQCDYVVVEGFKQAGVPKVAVVSPEHGLPDGVDKVVAVVYRGEAPEGYRSFTLDQIEALCDYLFEASILKKPGGRTGLVIDGRPVPLNEFVQASLAGVVRGFIATLRGTEQPTTIHLTITPGTDTRDRH